MKVLPSIVNIDQMGFMPGKSIDINLHGVFSHLQLPSEESCTRVLVGLDLEKIFDSIDWFYMA